METADLIPTIEAAGILGLERSTFLRWVQLGRIEPAMKIAGATGPFLFHRADVEAMLPTAHPRPRKVRT